MPSANVVTAANIRYISHVPESFYSGPLGGFHHAGRYVGNVNERKQYKQYSYRDVRCLEEDKSTRNGYPALALSIHQS